MYCLVEIFRFDERSCFGVQCFIAKEIGGVLAKWLFNSVLWLEFSKIVSGNVFEQLRKKAVLHCCFVCSVHTQQFTGGDSAQGQNVPSCSFLLQV